MLTTPHTVMQLQDEIQRGWYGKGKLKVGWYVVVTTAVAANTAVHIRAWMRTAAKFKGCWL